MSNFNLTPNSNMCYIAENYRERCNMPRDRGAQGRGVDRTGRKQAGNYYYCTITAKCRGRFSMRRYAYSPGRRAREITTVNALVSMYVESPGVCAHARTHSLDERQRATKNGWMHSRLKSNLALLRRASLSSKRDYTNKVERVTRARTHIHNAHTHLPDSLW